MLHITSYDNLELEGIIDIAFLGNLIHDFYHDEGHAQTVAYLKAIAGTLKPNGVLGITDHVGIESRDNAKLHRIAPAVVKKLLADAGLKIMATSDLYANKKDDHSLMVYEESIYRNTDRFFYRVGKI